MFAPRLMLMLAVAILTAGGCASLIEGPPDGPSQRRGFSTTQDSESDAKSSSPQSDQPRTAHQPGSTPKQSAGKPVAGDESEAAPAENAAENEDDNRSHQAALPRSLGSANREQQAETDADAPRKNPQRQAAEELAISGENSPAIMQVNKPAAPTGQTAQENEAALAAVIAELETLGELDAETKRQLIADLRETKPSLWQPMISIYRLALATRKRQESQGPMPQMPSEVQGLAGSSEPAHLPATSPANTASAVALSPGAQRQSPLRPAAGVAETQLPPPAVTYATDTAPAEAPAAPSKAPARLPLPAANHPALPAQQVQQATYEQPVSAVGKTAVRPVTAAEATSDANWQAYLEETITLLESQTSGTPRTTEEVKQQIELRLLQLAAGDRQAALRPIEGVSSTQQEFWSEGLFALATYLDSKTLPDGPRRAAEARRHLEAAITRLGELSTLTVRNLAFCTKVNSYGIYDTFEKYEFTPGKPVLLYAELENFKGEETPEGIVTAVRSSYQIFDSRGVRVESHDFAVTEEVCRNRRRDFFMRYFIDIPERIYDGEYTLKLTIEDLKGQTSGESTITFTVKEKGKQGDVGK